MYLQLSFSKLSSLLYVYIYFIGLVSSPTNIYANEKFGYSCLDLSLKGSF